MHYSLDDIWLGKHVNLGVIGIEFENSLIENSFLQSRGPPVPPGPSINEAGLF